MKAFHAETTITASPETIWKLLTNAPGYPEWDPGIIRIEGTIAPGEKITAFSKLSPGRGFPVKVSEFVPGKKMVWSSGMPFGLFKGARTFSLTPNSDGTTAFMLREEFSGPMLGLIGSSIPDMTENFAQFAEGLKSRAEQEEKRAVSPRS